MTDKKFDLSIIILNYNGQFWLKKLLPSIKNNYLKETTLKVEVVVVDNFSSDDSVELLEKNFKWVRLIKSDKNGGFAYGNNLAIRNNRARYLILLNSDTELLKNESNLDKLIEFAEKHPKIAVVSPKVELSSGKLDWACHRGEPTPWASFTYLTGLEKLFSKVKFFSGYHQSYKDMRKPHLIDAASGAAMLVRTTAIQKVGLLDENFFMYAEDIDWCKRFRDHGYSVAYYPLVKVIHHKYKSGIKSSNKKTSSITRKFFYDTMLQYYDKHYQNQYPKFVRQLLRYFIWIKTDVDSK